MSAKEVAVSLPMMKAVLLCMAFLFAGTTAAWAWYPYGELYERRQEGRPMTFGGWHQCSPTDHEGDGRVQERVARFKAAGLNDFLWIKPNHREWFLAAHEAGMPWRTSMRGSRKTLTEVLEATPGCAGLITAYGPYDNEDELEDLADWVSWTRETFPDLLSYSILVDRSVDRSFDYDRYIEKCRPDILAVEKFPIDRDGVTDPTYFPWLAEVAGVARDNHLPLWVTVQSFDAITATPRLPSFAGSRLDEADMRFQVFLSLAHGATGMHFFMYYGYEMSMVVDLGTPDPGSMGAGLPQKYEHTVLTRPWYAVRDMAPDVQALGRALLNLRPVGAVAYAGVVPDNCKAFEGHGGLLSASVADAAAGPLAVGLFDDEAGEEYFFVVNLVHGPLMSKLDGARTVRLIFKEDVEAVERLSRHTGRVEMLATESGTDGSRFLEFHLEGGTGDLFKWANGTPWDLQPPAPAP